MVWCFFVWFIGATVRYEHQLCHKSISFESTWSFHLPHLSLTFSLSLSLSLWMMIKDILLDSLFESSQISTRFDLYFSIPQALLALELHLSLNERFINLKKILFFTFFSTVLKLIIWYGLVLFCVVYWCYS